MSRSYKVSSHFDEANLLILVEEAEKMKHLSPSDNVVEDLSAVDTDPEDV